ncbi:MAG TPA: hypothetical protein VN975_12815 [Xanthobacteraceae bacterium]|jgi:hypothetical protein|nr:hypothetical protein [Xanthobacteraceae bacterium]
MLASARVIAAALAMASVSFAAVAQAVPPGAGERNDNFGSGLIDPLQALQLADPRTATTTPPPPMRPIRQR